MTTDQHEQQAAAFLSWHRKHERPFAEAWAFWADGKDFGAADRLAILRVVRDERIARGEASAEFEDWAA